MQNKRSTSRCDQTFVFSGLLSVSVVSIGVVSRQMSTPLCLHVFTSMCTCACVRVWGKVGELCRADWCVVSRRDEWKDAPVQSWSLVADAV